MILLLVVEGRVRLDGSLMVALGVCASEAVGLTHSVLAAHFRLSEQVRWQLLEEERLQLNKNSLNCVGRCPTLVDLLLFWIKYIKTDTGLIEDVRVRNRSEEADRGR